MDAASVNLLNTYVLQLHKPRKRSVKATVYVAQSKMISHQPEGGIPDANLKADQTKLILY